MTVAIRELKYLDDDRLAVMYQDGGFSIDNGDRRQTGERIHNMWDVGGEIVVLSNSRTDPPGWWTVRSLSDDGRTICEQAVSYITARKTVVHADGFVAYFNGYAVRVRSVGDPDDVRSVARGDMESCEVTALAFDPSTTSLAIAFETDGATVVKTFTVPDLTVIREVRFENRRITSMTWTSTQGLVLASETSICVNALCCNDWETVATPTTFLVSRLGIVGVQNDGTLHARGSNGVWHRALARLGGWNSVGALSPDGERVAWRAGDDKVRVWSLASMRLGLAVEQPRNVPVVSPDSISYLALSADERVSMVAGKRGLREVSLDLDAIIRKYGVYVGQIEDENLDLFQEGRIFTDLGVVIAPIEELVWPSRKRAVVIGKMKTGHIRNARDYQHTTDIWRAVFVTELRRRGLQAKPQCPECKESIDPDVCHCGDCERGHGPNSSCPRFIPIGCRCFYEEREELLPNAWRFLTAVADMGRTVIRHREIRSILRNLGEAIRLAAEYWPPCPEGCSTGCIAHGSYARGHAVGAGAWGLQYVRGCTRPYGTLSEFVPTTPSERGFLDAVLERNRYLSFRVGPDAVLDRDGTDERFAYLEQF